MKKQLLLGAFLLASTLGANAQILNETFTTAPEGWTVVDADGDAKNWGTYTGNATTDGWGLDGNFAGSVSWTQADGALTPDNFLITPGVEIPAGGATLTFLKGYTYYNAEDGVADQLSVYVVLADQTLEEVIAEEPLFDEVFDTPTDENTVVTATTATVDLSAYAGQTIALAFRHQGENQELIFLDTVVITEGTAGVDENTLSNLSVFPNPSNDVVNVTVEALVNNIAIVDLNGRTVKSVKFEGVSEAQVNVSDLASGVYMMTISSDKGTSTKKIVKN